MRNYFWNYLEEIISKNRGLGLLGDALKIFAEHTFLAAYPLLTLVAQPIFTERTLLTLVAQPNFTERQPNFTERQPNFTERTLLTLLAHPIFAERTLLQNFIGCTVHPNPCRPRPSYASLKRKSQRSFITLKDRNPNFLSSIHIRTQNSQGPPGSTHFLQVKFSYRRYL